MAMPDKKTTRPELARKLAHAQTMGSEERYLLAVLLALADAEWEREERAEELAALQADRELKADKENA